MEHIVRKYRVSGTGMKRSARAIEALSSFIEQNGTALVPTTHIQDGYRLGAWVTYIRGRQRNGAVDQELGNFLESLPGWTWGPLPPGPGAKIDRNVEIVDRASKGESLSHLASEFGVSRQRIHQIVKRSTAASSDA